MRHFLNLAQSLKCCATGNQINSMATIAKIYGHSLKILTTLCLQAIQKMNILIITGKELPGILMLLFNRETA